MEIFMNISNNARRKNTIKRIEEAFLSEMDKKELSQIRISDLCKLAEINRSTFYANYVDIYDLADEIFMKLEQDVFRLLFSNSNLSFNSGDFLQLFTHIQENQTLYRLYFKLGYEPKNNMRLCDMCIQEQFLNEELMDYHIAFFKNGFNAIVRKWLNGGCQETPQQMTAVLLTEYHGRIRPLKE